MRSPRGYWEAEGWGEMAAPCQTAGLTGQALSLFSGAVSKRTQPGLNWQPGTGAWGAVGCHSWRGYWISVSADLQGVTHLGLGEPEGIGPGPAVRGRLAAAWAWGQDLKSAFSLGGPAGSGLMACVWETGRGRMALRWLPLTSGATGCEGAVPLLVDYPKKSESVLVVRVQGGDSNGALRPFHGHCLGSSIPVPVLDQEGVELALRDCPGEVQRVRGGVRHPQRSQAGWGCWPGITPRH